MKQADQDLAARSAAGVQGTGAWRRGICLLCPGRTGKADRRASFSLHAESGFFVCHKCAARGRLDGYEGTVDVIAEAVRPKTVPPEGFTELGRGDGRTAISFERPREYLHGRGLTDVQVWRAARVGACLEGRFAKRVVVPILSPDGEWLGHVGRSWQKDAELPYLYGKGLQRRETLYNAAALNVQTDKPVMVVEGVLDALALWPDAVAVLGKPSEPQIWALADAARPVAVVLDGDAWSEGEALAMTLRLEGQRAGSVRLPPKTDPDEVDRGWLDEEVRRCLT